MSDTLIRVAKDGAHISVHPTCLESHLKLGWARAADQTPGADDLGQAEAAGEPALADLTVAALKALAAERGVDLGDAAKKADIVAALELAAEEAAAE
jgi:hypothetical protein